MRWLKQIKKCSLSTTLLIKKRVHYIERQWFPSPAEVAFARLMGAWVIRVPFVYRWWRFTTPYPLCIIIPAGWYRDTYIEREIKVRGYCIDFGNVAARRGIEIDGRAHHDIVADQMRDDHLAKSGWRILRIPAAQVLPNARDYAPNHVRLKARNFID